MAMGWDFSLAPDETGEVTFLLSKTMPTSGFYLTHTDPESFIPGTQIPVSIYFSSSLRITGNVPCGGPGRRMHFHPAPGGHDRTGAVPESLAHLPAVTVDRILLGTKPNTKNKQ